VNLNILPTDITYRTAQDAEKLKNSSKQKNYSKIKKSNSNEMRSRGRAAGCRNSPQKHFLFYDS